MTLERQDKMAKLSTNTSTYGVLDCQVTESEEGRPVRGWVTFEVPDLPPKEMLELQGPYTLVCDPPFGPVAVKLIARSDDSDGPTPGQRVTYVWEAVP